MTSQLIRSVLNNLQKTFEIIAQQEFVGQELDDLEKLLTSKGKDYSGQESTFKSFYRQAEITGFSVHNVFMLLIGLKISRLINLYETLEEPQFESVEDSWRDLAGYIVLYLSWRRFIREQDLEK